MPYLVNKITKEHKVFEPGTKLSGESLSEWKLVFADKDGWIPWKGGEECPVPEDQHIEYCLLEYGVDTVKKPERLRWWWWSEARGTNIISYRPILNSEPMSDNWEEEGLLPPVGTVCYYGSSQWSKSGEITYHLRSGRAAVIEYDDGGFDIGGALCFKPLESERECWVSNVSKKLCTYDSAGIINTKETAKFLYDSIVSGEIPIPKQEDVDQ